MTIKENVHHILDDIATIAQRCGRNPADITLCAATKTQSDEAIAEAVAAGVTICGENRVQELQSHLPANPYKGASLHFIGTLQSNKINQLVGTVDLIQSISSRKLIQGVSARAQKLEVVQDILLEVNLGSEASKSGFSPEELEEIAFFAAEQKNIFLRGFMAIPPNSRVFGDGEKYFERLYQLYIDISAKMSDNYNKLDCLSMGMSDDYPLAIAHGATLVRVGTALFGHR
ncbi:MAG: YggS family pyridoxal phosphate-dependent enzyme [Eubacteriales bacterium]